MIIGVDVDLTVVNSDRLWFDWCNSKCRNQLNYESLVAEGGTIPYHFGELFGFVNPGTALDFWNEESIYDELEPIPGAVEALEIISKTHEIVFVSKLMGNHFESKKQFLETHFPFMAGFIGTDQKHFARVDMLIDDRVDHLNKVQRVGILPIQYMTQYQQDEEPAASMFYVKSWQDLLCTDTDSVYDALFSHSRTAKV